MPGQPLRVPGGGAPRLQDNRHMKMVSPTHRPPLPPLRPQEIFLVLISVRGWVEPRTIVRPEGLCQWKIPMTPSGIESATFRLVAQCLNLLRHHYSAVTVDVMSLKQLRTETEDVTGRYADGHRCWTKFRIQVYMRIAEFVYCICY
jgi:hypothetical protein